MDATAPNDEVIVEEQATQGGDEDQYFDSLEDALDAFDDSEDPDAEKPAPAEDEQPDEELADADEDAGVFVDLDGEKLSIAELKAGYYRQKDYTHKTTEVAQERKAVEAVKATLAERETVLETALNNLSAYLQAAIPPEPPAALAYSDPGKHYAMQMDRQRIIAELNNLVAMRDPVDQTKQAQTQAEIKQYRDREQAALVKAMPALADPVRKTAFDQSVRAAAKAFGFADDEIAQVADHRVLQLVHYARLGKKAEENRKNAQQRVDTKVETPKAARAKSAPPRADADALKAVRRFAQTRSIKDAAKLDFD